MSNNGFLLFIYLISTSVNCMASDSVERLFWDKVPLQITLPVGKERLVTFPADVRLGIPGSLASKLRTQSNKGTVYWKASAAFEPQRIEIREIQSNRIYLVDLKASKKSHVMTPIEVINKQKQAQNKRQERVQGRRKSVKPPGYVALTRFAAQQLYAPGRLLKAAPTIQRVPIARHTTTHLIHGEQIAATPVASWKSGSLYVTAIELVNTGFLPIELDPRKLRGQWRTSTFQHARLHPAGSEADSTAVYLISDRPYHEAK